MAVHPREMPCDTGLGLRDVDDHTSGSNVPTFGGGSMGAALSDGPPRFK